MPNRQEKVLARKIVEAITARWDLAPRGVANAVKAWGGAVDKDFALATELRRLYAPLFEEAAKEKG